MLSYLTPTVHPSSTSSNSTSSSDDEHRSIYPHHDESHLNMFNSMATPSSAPMPYYPNAFGSFVYGHHNSFPHSFGLSGYEDMSAMTGENRSKSTTNIFNRSLLDPSRVPSYPLIHTTKRADPNIEVTLEHADLWKRFAELNLEMIITKNGR